MADLQKSDSRLPVFPETAKFENNHLFVGGCDTVALAADFGTPLYIFDEATLRHKCAEFTGEFSKRHANSLVIYACKAFVNRALALIFKEEGLGLDVVSGGELAIAGSVDFPMSRVYFHGNNKTPEELKLALKLGIGRVVVDNFHELSLLDRLAAERGVVQPVLLRLSPGVDPHTHRLTTTGVVDSKFGFTIVTGQAETAVKQALAASHVKLIGLHCHLGSPIFEMEPYEEAIDTVLDFAASMVAKYHFHLEEFSPGGGFAIQYVQEKPAPPIARYAQTIVSALSRKCGELRLPLPRLIVEPGRTIVGRAGVALYTVGARKDIPGIRNYVSVDGGMADNVRPALYEAKYEALVANRANDKASEVLSVAGKFCESGDILVKDISLPSLSAGDLLAVPAAGAYCLSMASNYNASLKPAIVLVKEGKARLIRRGESYDDLMSHDLT